MLALSCHVRSVFMTEINMENFIRNLSTKTVAISRKKKFCQEIYSCSIKQPVHRSGQALGVSAG